MSGKRHQMMQNLFGDQSEDDDDEEVDEEEIDSEHESNQHRPNYLSDGAPDQEEQEVEGERQVDGQGEAEDESEGEYHEEEPEVVESEGEREQSSQEVDAGGHQDESEAREIDTDDKEDYSHRVVTSKRREMVDSGSERSEEQEPQYIDPDDNEEVGQARSPEGSPEEERNQSHLPHSTAEIRDVFGDSDEEEPVEYGAQHDIEQEPKYLAEEEDSYEKNLEPDDLVPDEDAYGSEGEKGYKLKDKPLGPPMELEIPLQPPPALPEKMNLIRVSNIMGIDPKPFDPKTYVEEDVFVTDESGAKKRIRLENNIVRWRTVRKPDGTTACESNARFVKWSDGSLQLQIGNEVLDISVQDAQHDNAYLFLRHGKGILQSQGKLLKKMRFMPSSLSSNSHRLLTALVDSRHKKVFKVKNCVTDVDPEREKEKIERAESQTIKANSTLARKREKVNRRYTRPSDRGRQLSPGFLEDTFEEYDDTNYNDSRRSGSRRQFDDEMEAEARAERRIINAKKGQLKDIPRKSASAHKTSRRPVDFSDSDGSHYETDNEDEVDPERPYEDSEPEWQDSEDEPEPEPEPEVPEDLASEEEPEEPKQDAKGSLKRKEYESDEESPRKKPTTHRRMAVVYDSDDD